LILAGIVYFVLQTKNEESREFPSIKQRERTWEEIVKEDLTAPEGATINPLPEAMIKDLTVPEGAKIRPLSEDVIKNLTVPDLK